MTNAAAILQRYPVTPQHPPLRVRVHVQWNGRMYRAARVFHPRRKVLCWLTVRASDGSDQYLPPKGKPESGTWAPNPEWWAPEQPELWKAPLPPPLKLNGVVKDEVRMVDIGRGAKRRLGRVAGMIEDAKDRLPWWWLVDPDAPRLVYQPPGKVTRDMAEGRLMRAVSAAGVEETRALHGRIEFPMQYFADLSERAQNIIREERDRELVLPASAWQSRLRLDRSDHDDWLTAMSWFAALNPPETRHVGRRWGADQPWDLNNRQQVLIYRARCVGGPMSWKSIGEALDLHFTRCRQLYETAIDRAHLIANGGSVAQNIHMARLRERNRASKRGTGE